MLEPYRPPRGIVATQRYETEPGKQVQVDWGIGFYQDEKDGRSHKVYVLVMVLGYSRAMYAEFSNHCDIHRFLRGLIQGFSYFGGVTDIVLSDQMKTVILGWDEKRKPIWHPLFLDVALTLKFYPPGLSSQKTTNQRKG
jgi:transposase